MPELPEVETTLRGISPTMENRTISEVVVRNSSLRWPVPEEVQQACGRMVRRCWRRAKYLLIELDPLADGAVGGLLIHLGMSGSLRVCEAADAVRKHDHVDVVLDSGKCIRFNDPRRFGVFLWWNEPVQDHRLLKSLGPEPLSRGFSGDLLRQKSRGRKGAVKNFIMDGKIVVGVGTWMEKSWSAWATSMLRKLSTWPVFTPPGRQGESQPSVTMRWPPPSGMSSVAQSCMAERRCVIFSTRTETRAISPRSCWFTNVKACPVFNARHPSGER
jgi:hypothetical protein